MSCWPMRYRATHNLSAAAQLPVCSAIQFGRFAVLLYIDGSISKGAIYMLGVTSYEESRNRKNLAGSNTTNDDVTNVDRRNKAEVLFVTFLFSDVNI